MIMSSVSWHHRGGCQKHPHPLTVTVCTLDDWKGCLAGCLRAAHCHSLSLSFPFLPALVLGILWPPARGGSLASTLLPAAEISVAFEKEGGALPLAVRTLGSGHCLRAGKGSPARPCLGSVGRVPVVSVGHSASSACTRFTVSPLCQCHSAFPRDCSRGPKSTGGAFTCVPLCV